MLCTSKGDLLLSHGALAHRGARIGERSRERRSLVGKFTPLGNHHAMHCHCIHPSFAPGGATRPGVRARATPRSGPLKRWAHRVLGR